MIKDKTEDPETIHRKIGFRIQRPMPEELREERTWRRYKGA
jgi:hypothetical protein